ncbi:hypothetical protein PNOK_0608800 [Pyrrhoderma noxium]|uniref:Uncharacterized protein n=1 Tax=Pyrrhoderma noxium TaxID=2282107 RepID=A0A286UDB3_9AGAM|nr:hypothetical protein PNOK_0608800 [Pyrrhoderma noxium]
MPPTRAENKRNVRFTKVQSETRIPRKNEAGQGMGMGKSNNSVALKKSNTERVFGSSIQKDTITRRRISASLTPQASPRTRQSRNTEKENQKPGDAQLRKPTNQTSLVTTTDATKTQSDAQTLSIKARYGKYNSAMKPGSRTSTKVNFSSSREIVLSKPSKVAANHTSSPYTKMIKNLPDSLELQTLSMTPISDSSRCPSNTEENVKLYPSDLTIPSSPDTLKSDVCANQEVTIQSTAVTRSEFGTDDQGTSISPDPSLSSASSPLDYSNPDKVHILKEKRENTRLVVELSNITDSEAVPLSDLGSSPKPLFSTQKEETQCEREKITETVYEEAQHSSGRALIHSTEEFDFQAETSLVSAHSGYSDSNFSTYFRLDESGIYKNSPEDESHDLNIPSCESSSLRLESTSTHSEPRTPSKADASGNLRMITPDSTPSAYPDPKTTTHNESSVITRLFNFASAYIPGNTFESSSSNNKDNSIQAAGTLMNSSFGDITRKNPQAMRIADELASLRSGTWSGLTTGVIGITGAGSVLARARAFGSTIFSPTTRHRAQVADSQSDESDTDVKESKAISEVTSGCPSATSIPSGRDTIRRKSSLHSMVARKDIYLAKDLE